MTQEKFVVVDFIVRRKGSLPTQDGKTIKVSAEDLAERAVERVKVLLTKTLINPRGRVACELGTTGETTNRTRQGHPYLASLVIKNATMNDVMKMEDILRAESSKDLPSDEEASINLKMRDTKTKKYLSMEATEFRLNGPKGGEWKPFTEWYNGSKKLGLPL